LVEPEIGKARAKKIIELVWRLDRSASVDALLKACVMKE